MTTSVASKALSIGALLASLTLTSCGGGGSAGSAAQPAPVNAAATADVVTFEKNPTPATWEALHADLVSQQLTVAAESDIVRALSTGRVPANLFTATVVDLATLDWVGTVKWVRTVNVAARATSDTTAARSTAKMAWLMLAIRSSWAADFVDFSRMDLRASGDYLGRSVNLTNVDFAQSELSGANWIDASLNSANFDDVRVDGVLRCTNCLFGTVRYPSTLTLEYGKWVQI